MLRKDRNGTECATFTNHISLRELFCSVIFLNISRSHHAPGLGRRKVMSFFSEALKEFVRFIFSFTDDSVGVSHNRRLWKRRIPAVASSARNCYKNKSLVFCGLTNSSALVVWLRCSLS